MCPSIWKRCGRCMSQPLKPLIIAGGVYWAISVLVTVPAGAMDQGPDEVDFPDAVCGAAFTPTKQNARAATTEDIYGHDRDASLPPFLVGSLPSPSSGVVFFIKRPSRWVGVAGEQSHDVQKLYVAPDKGHAALFTMWSVEGPGHDYTIMATKDGFASVSCSTLEFPEEVKSPENFMELVDFNVDDTGRGALIGKADLTSDDGAASQTHWYVYRTEDDGKTWSAPEVSQEKPAELPGVYLSLDDGGFCDLKSDLVESLQ